MTFTSQGDIWQIGPHRLYCEDAANIQHDTKADLIFTSPPYNQQRNYISGSPPWDDLMQSVFSNLPTHDDTQIIVNLGIIHNHCEWQPYWTTWIEWMRQQGWRRFGWYVWDKQSALPGQWHGRLGGGCFEFLFHFNKTSRLPNKTKPKLAKNIAYNRRPGCLRRADGVMAPVGNREAYLNTHKIPDSVVRLPPDKHNRANEFGVHPARFPVKLASELIEAFTNEGDTVYDPFAGSGSTIIAAHELSRIGIGAEIEPQYADLAIDRIQRHTRLIARNQDNRTFDSFIAPDFFAP